MSTVRSMQRAAIAILGLLATACSPPSPEALSSAVPASSAFLSHLRPADLGRELEAVQLVTVTHGTQSVVIDVRLSLASDRLVLVAQDMLGQRLMTILWSDTGIVEERSPNLPALVSPVGLLADLVAICGPEDAVARALERVGAVLLVEGRQRIIRRGTEETLRATLGWQARAPWTGRAGYRNVRADYSVDIQSVEQP